MESVGGEPVQRRALSRVRCELSIRPRIGCWKRTQVRENETRIDTAVQAPWYNSNKAHRFEAELMRRAYTSLKRL